MAWADSPQANIEDSIVLIIGNLECWSVIDSSHKRPGVHRRYFVVAWADRPQANNEDSVNHW